MPGLNQQQLQSDQRSTLAWSSTQAYGMAVFCLIVGVALGYLFRGSASSVPAAAAAPPSNAAQVDANQAALQQSVALLLEALQKNPGDYDLLVKLGDLYYDGQQFSNAIPYYERALAIHPESPDVRTDMGTAYWYAGDADKALAELQTSLKYKPTHPQSLFNLGWIRWQGKSDAKGAVDAWEKLLKTNPDYPQKEQVEKYIAKAKGHAARG